MTLSEVQTIQYQTMEIINDELERIWKEAVMTSLMYYHDVSLERPRKITKTSVPGQDLKLNLQNMKQMC
jgi:hypothetical protein